MYAHHSILSCFGQTYEEFLVCTHYVLEAYIERNDRREKCVDMCDNEKVQGIFNRPTIEPLANWSRPGPEKQQKLELLAH